METTEPPLYDATGRDEIMTVADAAEVLGITPGAVRKRIERGQLAGQKIHGQWRVFLNATDLDEATRQQTTPRPERMRQHDTATATSDVVVSRRPQLDLFRDELLMPLIARLEEHARTIGRLEAERDAAAHLVAEHAAAVEAERRRHATDNQQADELVTLLEARIRELEGGQE